MNSEGAAEDIPHEELMQLCMKMNKRMQAMETKGKELVKRKASLLNDRQKLLFIIQSAANFTMVIPDDQEIDMSIVESHWQKWENNSRNKLLDLEQKLLIADQYMSNSAALSVNNSCDTAHEHTSPNEENSSEMNKILREREVLRASLVDLQSRNLTSDSELDRLRSVESHYKQQQIVLEKSVSDRNIQIEQLRKEAESNRLVFEEKLLFLQMQLNALKAKEDAKDKDLAAARKQVEKLVAQMSALQQINEEKDMSVRSNKEMISALQERLIELEPELAIAKDRLRDMERNGTATVLLKVEQEALLASVRKDLKLTVEEREEALRRVKELDEFRVKAEGQLLKMAALGEQVSALQTEAEEKASFITRLRSEAQVSERNHAMRTAMLATCEAQLEAAQQELVNKEATANEVLERVAQLQLALAASEARLEERVKEFSDQMAALVQKGNAAEQAHAAAVKGLSAQFEESLEAAKRDHSKKSSMARTLLSEREEEVRLLSAKVAELQEEISSGAPSERKIFELAKTQAMREATHGIHSDTRELAFQQLQTALAAKDLELARNQQSLSFLTAEVLELRRTHQRDGINMDYLKNIIIQYMTLPMQSSEKMSLVPVIAMLLQFTPKEIAAVQKSDREPIWGSKPIKEVKRFSAPSLTPRAAANNVHHKIAANNHNGSTVISSSGSSSSGGVAQYVLPAKVIIGSADDSAGGGYVPPLSNNANGDDAPASASGGADVSSRQQKRLVRDPHDAMSQSDRDFHEKMELLRSMDVLNISNSDGDLQGRAVTLASPPAGAPSHSL